MPATKLLIADDSLTIQKVIKLALSNEGFDIKAVSDGNEALEQLALFQPDIILIDHSLPEKTAFEIKEHYNQSPELKPGIKFVLMLSAYEDLDEHQNEMLGFHDRLVKPFDPAHLRKVIHSDEEASSGAKKKSVKSAPTPPPLRAAPTPPPAPQKAPAKSKATPPAKPPEFSSPKMPQAPVFNPEGEIFEKAPQSAPKNALKPADIETSGEHTFSSIQSDNLWDSGDDDVEVDEKTPSLPKIEFGEDDQSYITPKGIEEQLDDPIRGLAEETISRSESGEFSGDSEDLQWSVSDRLLKDDEHGPEITPNSEATGEFEFNRTDDPSIPPPPNQMDHGGNTLDLSQVDKETETDLSIRRPKPTATPPAPSVSQKKTAPPKPPASPTSPKVSANANPEIMPLSTRQMEEMIEEQLKSALHKMIEKSLPEIAEKIVKEEIHKMLSDPPKGL